MLESQKNIELNNINNLNDINKINVVNENQNIIPQSVPKSENFPIQVIRRLGFYDRNDPEFRDMVNEYYF
jgi:hypothetical protein